MDSEDAKTGSPAASFTHAEEIEQFITCCLKERLEIHIYFPLYSFIGYLFFQEPAVFACLENWNNKAYDNLQQVNKVNKALD